MKEISVIFMEKIEPTYMKINLQCLKTLKIRRILDNPHQIIQLRGEHAQESKVKGKLIDNYKITSTILFFESMMQYAIERTLPCFIQECNNTQGFLQKKEEMYIKNTIISKSQLPTIACRKHEHI